MTNLGFEIPRFGTQRTRLQMQCAERKALRPQIRKLAKLKQQVKSLREEKKTTRDKVKQLEVQLAKKNKQREQQLHALRVRAARAEMALVPTKDQLLISKLVDEGLLIQVVADKFELEWDVVALIAGELG